MKLLVLGASGMAGHVIATYFKELGHSVETLAAHHKLDSETKLIDAADQKQLLAEVDKGAYSVLINCIGVLVRESEEKKDKAVYLNAYLPRLLENHCQGTSTKIVHISTDGIFSGAQAEYVEDSLYDGQSLYSRSKALGEIDNSKDLTIRTSIIGPDLNAAGRSLFNWFYTQSGEIEGYVSSFWRGVTTIELAKAIEAAIDQDLTGIYHLGPRETISKYDLLLLLKEAFRRDELRIRKSSATTTNTNLRNTRQDFNYRFPDYNIMLHEMSSWIETHQELYPHYGH